MKKGTLLFLLCISLTGCIMDYYDKRLYVVNKSSVRIAVEVVNDTTARTENEIAYYLSKAIAPNDTSFITKAGKNGWLEYAEAGKSKTLYTYFFDVDTLSKYQNGGADMSYLIGNKKYVKRLNYSLEKLKQTNWGIEFK